MDEEMGVQIEYVKGDLIQMTKEGQFNAVGHGCNCFHAMGSGIAPKLNNLSGGRLLSMDRSTTYGDINKLGSVSITMYNAETGHSVVLVNMYTQFVHGGHFRKGQKHGPLVHWVAFEKSLRTILGAMGGHAVLGIPLIGCGLAGGSRADFEQVLTNIQQDDDLSGKIVVVEYDG